MELLTASQFYPLEAALSICQRRGMVSEQVKGGLWGNAAPALPALGLPPGTMDEGWAQSGAASPPSPVSGLGARAHTPLVHWSRSRCTS